MLNYIYIYIYKLGFFGLASITEILRSEVANTLFSGKTWLF
jgi:hypothetical protein